MHRNSSNRETRGRIAFVSDFWRFGRVGLDIREVISKDQAAPVSAKTEIYRLSLARFEKLNQSPGIPPGEDFPASVPDSEEDEYISERISALRWPNPPKLAASSKVHVWQRLCAVYRAKLSIQSAFRPILLSLSRQPKIAKHSATLSPGFPTSTNVGGGTHRMGVHSRLGRSLWALAPSVEAAYNRIRTALTESTHKP